jgi:hypothetical protein
MTRKLSGVALIAAGGLLLLPGLNLLRLLLSSGTTLIVVAPLPALLFSWLGAATLAGLGAALAGILLLMRTPRKI